MRELKGQIGNSCRHVLNYGGFKEEAAMGNKPKELGPCECNGPQTRTYDFDLDVTTTADAEFVREISRGEPGPWFISEFQLGPEKLRTRVRHIPYKGIWKVVEVSWEAQITQTDACKAAAWEGGPSFDVPGFGWVDSHWCVWVPVSRKYSLIKIKSKKTIEIQYSGYVIEFEVQRQTEVTVGTSFSLGPLPGIGGKTGIQWDPVTIESNTVYVGPSTNTPEPVLSELHK